MLPELSAVEKGIPVKEFLDLTLESGAECTEANHSRDLEMEYRILMRVNCHKAQFSNLFRNSSADFRRKNKYNEILPYKHNMVRLRTNDSEDLSFSTA